jgi:hypothetical protein
VTIQFRSRRRKWLAILAFFAAFLAIPVGGLVKDERDLNAAERIAREANIDLPLISEGRGRTPGSISSNGARNGGRSYWSAVYEPRDEDAPWCTAGSEIVAEWEDLEDVEGPVDMVGPEEGCRWSGAAGGHDVVVTEVHTGRLTYIRVLVRA